MTANTVEFDCRFFSEGFDAFVEEFHRNTNAVFAVTDESSGYRFVELESKDINIYPILKFLENHGFSIFTQRTAKVESYKPYGNQSTIMYSNTMRVVNTYYKRFDDFAMIVTLHSSFAREPKTAEMLSAFSLQIATEI